MSASSAQSEKRFRFLRLPPIFWSVSRVKPKKISRLQRCLLKRSDLHGCTFSLIPDGMVRRLLQDLSSCPSRKNLPAASKRTPAHPLPRQRKRLPHAGQSSDTSRLQTRGTRPDCRLRSCRRLRARRLTRTSHDTRTTTAMPTSASSTREALKCCSKPHRVALSHAGW